MNESQMELKLHQIRALVVGVGRTGRPNDGMDMLADSVLHILDEGPMPYTTANPVIGHPPNSG